MSTPEKVILAVLIIFAILMWLLPLAAGISVKDSKIRGAPKKGAKSQPRKAEFFRGNTRSLEVTNLL